MNGSNAAKIQALIGEMKVKAEDINISDYFRECYVGHAAAADLMLHQGYNEEQLGRQLEHFKSNLSTLQMVINSFKGIGDPEYEDTSEIKYIQLTLF